MRTTDIIRRPSSKGDAQGEAFSLRGMETPPIKEEDPERAHTLYARAKEGLEKVFTAIKEGGAFSIDHLIPFAKDFVEGILVNPYYLLHQLYRDGLMGDLAAHSLNTSIVSIKIGIGFGLERRALEVIATGGFLYDVGMLTIPQEIVKKPGRLSPEEYEVIKKHPENGFKILSQLGDRYRILAEIAYQQHERIDGSGYPRGLKGAQIHEYALIIGIADMYAALIHPRPQRKRFLPFEAVKEIIATSREKFPLPIIKAMINELSAFPIGLYVKLNSGEVGRVVGTNRLAPLRPTVEVLYDRGGQRLKEKKVVDLTRESLLRVVSAFFQEEAGDPNVKIQMSNRED